MRPCSYEGTPVQAVRRGLLAAHARGELEVTIGRAADLFRPGTPESVYGDRLVAALQAGKAELPRARLFRFCP